MSGANEIKGVGRVSVTGPPTRDSYVTSATCRDEGTWRKRFLQYRNAKDRSDGGCANIRFPCIAPSSSASTCQTVTQSQLDTSPVFTGRRDGFLGFSISWEEHGDGVCSSESQLRDTV